MAGGERRLAAIMFTDIVGYTHLSQTNETLALELLEEHQSLLRPSFAAHGGTEVKTIGDAFLVEFRSALDAVTCAVELQKKMGERNVGGPSSRRVEVRIGIHVGDVVHGTGDILGDAVNVASRIEPLAEPGGICISQQVYDQIRNKTSLEIEKLGDVRLKNVDLPMKVYRIKMASNGRMTAEPSRQRERLGVLPFVNISPDPNDEYFADGLTEELISKLSEIRGLKVIARTSVMSYKRTSKKISEIADELDVGTVIEGSVRKAGDKVRISVQLVDAVTEEHLWAANYDSKLDDIFAIQSDVASKVAGALSTGFFARTPRKDTHNVEAYTLYLKAVQLSYQGESTGKQVIALLERAIVLDPNFARAYAALADNWHGTASAGVEEFDVMSKKAETYAKMALALDPDLAEAHAAMAGVHSLLDQFDLALKETEVAVRLNPNLSEAYMNLGVLDSIMRTPGEALQMFRRAYELDPLSPFAAGTLVNLAQWAGDEALALEVMTRMKELNPESPMIYLGHADYYMEKKDFGEAQRMIDAARRVDPSHPAIVVSEGILFAMTGRRKEAEEKVKEILAGGSVAFKLTGEFQVQVALGNLDRAFEILMREAEMHSWPFQIRCDPFYAEMRRDPRFLEFCKKVGIPP
ncbi:MAG: tetratricopeptide repeat protein [Thaumarchaeota archaeon]|nr:tetratricopeptide repeat protein [Nitrososphaerota archaeon]